MRVIGLGWRPARTATGWIRALESTGMREYFHATRTADQTFSKPHPAMLLELMDELGVSAERTLMIGDTTHDLQMAMNAGVDAVAVGHGAHPPEQLRELNPLALLNDFVELRVVQSQRLTNLLKELQCQNKTTTGNAACWKSWRCRPLQEQRRARHWGIFFKVLTFGYSVHRAVHLHGLDGQKRDCAEHRQTHRAGGYAGRDRGGQHGKCRQSDSQPAGCIQGQEHAGRDPAHQQSRRQPGAGRTDQ